MLVSPRTRDCLGLFLSTVSCQVYLCLLPVSSGRNVSNTLGTKSSGKCHVLEEMKLFIVRGPSLLSKNAVDSADSTLPESSRLQFMLLWNDFWSAVLSSQPCWTLCSPHRLQTLPALVWCSWADVGLQTSLLLYSLFPFAFCMPPMLVNWKCYFYNSHRLILSSLN